MVLVERGAMRMLRRIILVVTAILAVAPATAQRYDPRYPVCFQKWGEGGFTAIDCSYTSLDQCRMTASGRSAMCYANPYWPRAHQASPGGVHRRQGRVYYDTDVAKLAKRLANEGRRLAFCNEVGGCVMAFSDNSSISARQHGGGAVADCPQARIKTD
jgi:hypothetical protein